jgi:tetratricopeptide (TPR) repeat protein
LDSTVAEVVAQPEEENIEATVGGQRVENAQTVLGPNLGTNDDVKEDELEILEYFVPEKEEIIEPNSLESGTALEDEAVELDMEFIEPFAQAKVDIGEVQENLTQTPTNNDSPCEKNESDKNSELSAVTNAPDVDEPDTPLMDLGLEEKEICVEEEKLAKQIEINPRSATTWEALGTLYKTAGRYEEAIQAFEQAISISPSEVSYFHNLGLVYAAQGNNQDAFNTFQKVLELDPNHSLTHASLGGYYKKMGLDELAQKHIGKAMKQIYESENEYNRACLDAICGNIDQAIDLLRLALENKQTYVDWVLNDPDLDPLREDERFKQLIADFNT